MKSEVNSPIIRLATSNDAAAIAKVLHESFLEYESQYTPEGFAATTPSPDEVLSRLNEGPIWVVLIDNNVVVGTVSVAKKNESLYVRGMAVSPHARGSRIGERLLTIVVEYARHEHSTRVFLSTTPFLDKAIRLYENFGFKRIAEGPHNLHGTPLFSMEMIVSSDS